MARGYQGEARVEKLSMGNKAKSTDKRGGQKKKRWGKWSERKKDERLENRIGDKTSE